MNRIRSAIVLSLAAALGACAHHRAPPPTAAPTPREPSAAERYAALPDTSICVVDRSTSRGLRSLPAKRDAGGHVVVLASGAIRPFSELHPVNATAGYAGRETWLTGGAPITVEGRAYVKVGGERLVPFDQVQRVADYAAVPVFASPSDTQPPKAVYVPVRPGCVFQAYVRQDLVSGS
jgi:hypothetical protein